MLCYRISLKGKFLGLIHKCDKDELRNLVKKFGIAQLAIVPVVVL
jgi:hypothetical protein